MFAICHHIAYSHLTQQTSVFFWNIKGGPQNRGIFDRKFKIVRIGQFWRFKRDWMWKICGIVWVSKKNHMKWNLRPLANFEVKFCWKLLYKNEKSLFQCCTWMFYVEIGILWFRDIEKRPPSFKYWGPASCPSHNSE